MSTVRPDDASREVVVERARDGDEHAWRDLFDEYYPRLYRFFIARASSSQVADDLAQETFLDAYRGLHGFRWRNRPFGAWLFAVARNRLRMYYRQRRPQDGLPDDIPAVRDEYLDLEIRDVLARLSPEHRQAIEYRYVIGLTGEEAAAAMGRSHGAFRALLHRASAAFRAEFDGEARSA